MVIPPLVLPAERMEAASVEVLGFEATAAPAAVPVGVGKRNGSVSPRPVDVADLDCRVTVVQSPSVKVDPSCEEVDVKSPPPGFAAAMGLM